ncbi:LLM class flavin-dependent oxidoreductase [Spiractinospora alimapuensis]|uniref:LLM class flavin-dependent oxidoreductase n=1 Tax=Spiractinospora alimapuensis TaxID=2820884 RepID=UPI001F3DD998|nr:LLM class flavin-dependent oxidoreductase [Spiractinospora alimapuensis]QVQ50044.1 LLM class flavin-dependent oxidoreductase [Spiractinospora alimapuensis]
MALTFHWFLPTQGDSRGIVGGGHGVAVDSAWRTREPSTEYLAQVARAAEQLGFEGALTPTGAWCEDAWITTAMLVGITERLKFLVAFRPGLLSPTLAAQMASTYQRLSRGRLLLNVVTGGESAEQRTHGDFLSKDERYARTDEFLSVVNRLWDGETVTHDGEHLRVERAALARTPAPRPPVYFGGSSPAALEVAAKRVDTYLTWGEPPGAVADKVDRVRALATRRGRALEYGIRLHVITRDTSEDAWRAADRLLEHLDPGTVAAVQAGLGRSESEGQRRMLDLHGGTRDGLEIYPNLWAGVGLARGGAGTALVGSHTEVADRIEEYARAGISEFVMSGYPHLEEAYWFGEGVLPILRDRGVWEPPGDTPASVAGAGGFQGGAFTAAYAR